MPLNITLDAFVMALACFLTNDQNPNPVYLNSQPNFLLSKSVVGCQMHHFEVMTLRLDQMTLLKQQQTQQIADLEKTVANLTSSISYHESTIQTQIQQIDTYKKQINDQQNIISQNKRVTAQLQNSELVDCRNKITSLEEKIRNTPAPLAQGPYNHNHGSNWPGPHGSHGFQHSHSFHCP